MCDLHNVAAYRRENVDFIDVGKGLAKGRVRQFESLTMFWRMLKAIIAVHRRKFELAVLSLVAHINVKECKIDEKH